MSPELDYFNSIVVAEIKPNTEILGLGEASHLPASEVNFLPIGAYKVKNLNSFAFSTVNQLAAEHTKMDSKLIMIICLLLFINRGQIIKKKGKVGKYEIVEFANGFQWSSPKLQQLPWRAYGSLPDNPALIEKLNKDRRSTLKNGRSRIKM